MDFRGIDGYVDKSVKKENTALLIECTWCKKKTNNRYYYSLRSNGTAYDFTCYDCHAQNPKRGTFNYHESRSYSTLMHDSYLDESDIEPRACPCIIT